MTKLSVPSLNGHTPSDEEYLDYMRVVTSHSPVAFYQVRADHVRYLRCDGDAAIVLAYLLGVLRMKHDNDEDRRRLRGNMLWFKCEAKSIMRQLSISKHRLPRCLSVLKAKGLIQTDVRGVPPTTWVRVSAEKLAKIEAWDLRRTQKPAKRVFENPESGSTLTRKAGLYTTNKPSKKLPLRGTARGSGVPSLIDKKRPPFCYQAQDEFRKLLREHGHPLVYGRCRTGWTPDQGAEWVANLLGHLDGDEARLLRTLRWYPVKAKQIAASGGPRAVFSIKTFCHPEMFLSLENRRLKEQGPDDDLEDVEHQPDYYIKEPVPGRPGSFTKLINPKYLKRRSS